MSSINMLSTSKESWYDNFQLSQLETTNDYEVKYSTNNYLALKSFNSTLNKLQMQSGLIPPGLRLSIPGFLIFERPPTRKLIQYIDLNVDTIIEYEEEEEPVNTSVHEIPIPWQLYMVAYSTNPASMYRTLEVNMFFMNTSLISDDVKLYAPYVNNFYTNGQLCPPMFERDWEINHYPQDLSGVIASAYDWVWNTGFNADLKECIDQTVYQDLDNHIVNSFKQDPDNQHLYSDTIASKFYRYISKYSPEDVTPLTWANPSYEYNHDRDYLFMWQNALHPFCETISEEELRLSNSHLYREFRDTISHPSTYSKTYSDIINSLFFLQNNRHYTKMLNPLDTTFDNLNYLSHHISQSIILHPSV